LFLSIRTPPKFKKKKEKVRKKERKEEKKKLNNSGFKMLKYPLASIFCESLNLTIFEILDLFIVHVEMARNLDEYDWLTQDI
jgi:hypothetical protein